MGGQRPAMHDGIHPFHREVRALDESHLDAGAPAVDPLLSPGGELPQGRQRIGKVGLQDDARLQVTQPRILQQPGEHRDRQVEVAVLLHVQIDERLSGLGPRRGGGRQVQREQAVDHPVDDLVEGPHRDVARDGRHLHRNVVDVVATDEIVDALQAAQRFGFAQHGFAQEIQIEARTGFPDGRQSGAQLVGPGIDDEVPDHLAQRFARDRHRRRRKNRPDGTRGAHRRPQVPGQELRNQRRHALQVRRGGAQRLGTHDTVDEADRERQPVRILEHARQPFGGGIDVGSRRLVHPASRQRDGAVGERGCRRRRGGVVGHVSRVHCVHASSVRHAYDSAKAMIFDGYRSMTAMFSPARPRRSRDDGDG